MRHYLLGQGLVHHPGIPRNQPVHLQLAHPHQPTLGRLGLAGATAVLPRLSPNPCTKAERKTRAASPGAKRYLAAPPGTPQMFAIGRYRQGLFPAQNPQHILSPGQHGLLQSCQLHIQEPEEAIHRGLGG